MLACTTSRNHHSSTTSVPDYVPDQQTIYYIESSEEYSTYSPPQQAETPYYEGLIVDTELDQQPYGYAEMICNSDPPHDRCTNAQQAAARKRGRKPLPKAPVTESEFYCLPCNQAFKRRRGLSQHNHYIHSGPKEHQCAQCGKKYPSLELLQAHVRKHNDAFKPYGCPHCTKRFSRPHDMKRHIWTSHGEAPFGCSFCDKRFGRLDYAEQHEISHKNKTVIVKKN
ncbi:hypothetical protein pipiens_016732 [Culex pipiens pipiens]|uniref:C2H2-type domain-containing protein n=1 Tax=Culex pipiens pipiens TaxID=38569 RepID=A0ABD1CK04_CULPP